MRKKVSAVREQEPTDGNGPINITQINASSDTLSSDDQGEFVTISWHKQADLGSESLSAVEVFSAIVFFLWPSSMVISTKPSAGSPSSWKHIVGVKMMVIF
jgi:hypothetical protein